jgi:hypothetical protein
MYDVTTMFTFFETIYTSFAEVNSAAAVISFPHVSSALCPIKLLQEQVNFFTLPLWLVFDAFNSAKCQDG